MKKSLSRLIYVSPSACILVCLAGCSQQTIDSATQDAAHDAHIVQREAARAEKKAEPDLKMLGLGARVTVALRANQNLPSTIRVDASQAGVTLRGTVDTERQRTLAATIARSTLSEKYSVTNDLKVKGL